MLQYNKKLNLYDTKEQRLRGFNQRHLSFVDIWFPAMSASRVCHIHERGDQRESQETTQHSQYDGVGVVRVRTVIIVITVAPAPSYWLLWKVVAKEGECGFLDACGEPEPMKSEIMAGRDSYEMKRLDYGKVLLQTNSKFLPAELTMAADEHWDAELPDLGKVLGVMTEMKRILMIVLKLNKKTITIRLTINGDFLVQECDVDGEDASKMKVIMVRQ